MAKDANLIEAVNCRFGEKDEFRGSGFGPCTAQDNLIVEVVGMKFLDDEGTSSSKYAEPAAAGTTPVCRTTRN